MCSLNYLLITLYIFVSVLYIVYFNLLYSYVIIDWQVSGALPVRPSISFAHFGFDEQLMGAIRKLEYTQPTPIQCQV